MWPQGIRGSASSWQVPKTNGQGAPAAEGSAGTLALIRRFTSTGAPGLADRVGALPPFSPRNPSTGSHSHGLSYRMRLDTLGAGVRAGQDGRGSTADVAGAGSAIAPLPWRWSNWPGPAPAEGAPQSLGAQLPVVARLPLPPVHLRPKAGAERSGGRRCSFRK